ATTTSRTTRPSIAPPSPRNESLRVQHRCLIESRRPGEHNMAVLRSFTTLLYAASLLACAAFPSLAQATTDLAEQKRTATIVAEFERLSDAVLRTGQTPALAAVVVKDGAIVSVRGIGISE